MGETYLRSYWKYTLVLLVPLNALLLMGATIRGDEGDPGFGLAIVSRMLLLVALPALLVCLWMYVRHGGSLPRSPLFWVVAGVFVYSLAFPYTPSYLVFLFAAVAYFLLRQRRKIRKAQEEEQERVRRTEQEERLAAQREEARLLAEKREEERKEEERRQEEYIKTLPLEKAVEYRMWLWERDMRLAEQMAHEAQQEKDETLSTAQQDLKRREQEKKLADAARFALQAKNAADYAAYVNATKKPGANIEALRQERKRSLRDPLHRFDPNVGASRGQ